MIRTTLMVAGGPVADDLLSHWSSPDDGFSGGRQRSLLGRALLRRLLVDATGLSPAGWTFVAEPSGRLTVRHRQCHHPPSVSLSHSGCWVACAISDAGPLGIDIETQCPRRNFSRIAAAVFGPGEQSQVTTYGAAGFYRIWTLKEAMAKASGKGILEMTDRTDRVTGGPNEGSWRAEDGETLWWLAYTTPLRGLSLAMAVEDVNHSSLELLLCDESWQNLNACGFGIESHQRDKDELREILATG